MRSVEENKGLDVEEEGCPTADEIVLRSEATEAEPFSLYDNDARRKCCRLQSPYYRQLYKALTSIASKSRFVFVLSTIGGISGLVAFTLSGNTLYSLHASGCDNELTPAFLDSNRTEDVWRITPSDGVCPQSGKVKTCTESGGESQCYTVDLNCFSFHNETAWARLDEWNAENGLVTNLKQERLVWVGAEHNLYIAAICTVLLGIGAIGGDIIVSKLILSPCWNQLRYRCRDWLGTLDESAAGETIRSTRGGRTEEDVGADTGEGVAENGDIDNDGWEQHDHLLEGDIELGGGGLLVGSSGGPGADNEDSERTEEEGQEQDESESEEGFTDRRGAYGRSTHRALPASTSIERLGDRDSENDSNHSNDSHHSSSRPVGAGVGMVSMLRAHPISSSGSSSTEAGEEKEENSSMNGTEVAGTTQEQSPSRFGHATPALISPYEDNGRQEEGLSLSGANTHTFIADYSDAIIAEPVDSDHSEENSAYYGGDGSSRFRSGCSHSGEEGGRTRASSSSSSSFSSSSMARRSRSFSGGSIVKKEIPVATGALRMQLAESHGVTDANHAWVVRCLDTNFDDFVGKEWPFFKLVCLLQLASFVLIVDSYARIHETQQLQIETWNTYFLQSCDDVYFELSADQEYTTFVEVVTMLSFCIMTLHLVLRSYKLFECDFGCT